MNYNGVTYIPCPGVHNFTERDGYIFTSDGQGCTICSPQSREGLNSFQIYCTVRLLEIKGPYLRRSDEGYQYRATTLFCLAKSL